jgi:N-acetylneuraminic acid mutarotase
MFRIILFTIITLLSCNQLPESPENIWNLSDPDAPNYVPPKPQITNVNIYSDSIYIQWDHYSINIIGYEVQKKINDGTYFHSELIDSGKYIYIDKNIYPGNRYNYLIRAKTKNSHSTYDTTKNIMVFNQESVSEINQKRYNPTLTLIDNNRVLVCGGHINIYNGLDICEVYDPNLNIWSNTEPLAQGRWEHTTTLMPSGKVVVIGGRGDTHHYLSSCEIFDPATMQWDSLPDMNFPRTDHTASLISDTKILVTGGKISDFDFTETCEVFDFDSMNWKFVVPMNHNKYSHSAINFETNKIMTIGGIQYLGGGYHSGLKSCDIYLIDQNKWENGPSLKNYANALSAIKLTNDDIIITPHNEDDNFKNIAQIYENDKSQWSELPKSFADLRKTIPIYWKNRYILFIRDSNVIYDMENQIWFEINQNLFSAQGWRKSTQAILLNNNRIFILNYNKCEIIY